MRNFGIDQGGVSSQFIETLLYQSEGTALDFKLKQYPFNGATDEEKSELLKDILAFANSWRREEAFIVVGVQTVVGITVPKRENCTLRLKAFPHKHLSHQFFNNPRKWYWAEIGCNFRKSGRKGLAVSKF
jgi:hypothetical protein